MFSESSPCLLGQHSSCSTAQQPVELSKNILQNLFHNLTPQTSFSVFLKSQPFDWIPSNRRLVGRAATPDTKKKSSASASEDGSGEPIVDLQVQHVLEASNKSHVQALLKLRQYKKNLKYAIWDYQARMMS